MCSYAACFLGEAFFFAEVRYEILGNAPLTQRRDEVTWYAGQAITRKNQSNTKTREAETGIRAPSAMYQAPGSYLKNRFVEGHGFSRAVKSPMNMWA
jgi:hypothetical protein